MKNLEILPLPADINQNSFTIRVIKSLILLCSKNMKLVYNYVIY